MSNAHKVFPQELTIGASYECAEERSGNEMCDCRGTYGAEPREGIYKCESCVTPCGWANPLCTKCVKCYCAKYSQVYPGCSNAVNNPLSNS
jgi:hypothetical protein